MKKIIVVLALLISIHGWAQFPIAEIIKAGITKIIKAVDLKIQKLQNKTIWLQNAEKALENTMSKLRLNEIKDWTEKQRKLYADYFEELRKVKTAISYYGRVREIMDQQVQIINEYKAAWALFKRDKNFTPEELDYMFSVYTGILDQSGKNIDQLFLVVNAFVTQMSDAKRLAIVNSVADHVETNLMDLKEFNQENKMLSLQRANEQGDIDYVKKLYGL
jgi:ATP-dependent 26S proteasome regulatory subunit